MRSAISISPWINPLYNLIDEHLRDVELAKTLMGDTGVDRVYELYFSAYSIIGLKRKLSSLSTTIAKYPSEEYTNRILKSEE